MASTTLNQNGGTKWSNLTQAQWKDYLQGLLMRSDKALESAIVRIYTCMTQEEQDKGRSYNYDGVGFNRYDTETMSIMAKHLLAGNHLSTRQKGIARAKMPKYWRQLMKLSKVKQGLL